MKFVAVTTAIALALGASFVAYSPLSAATDAKPLSEQTRKNLEAAMHGEAYANLKYLRYAELARASGNEALAKLFEESANVEANEHFDREAAALGLGSGDSANLLDAMAGEHYENTQMYIGFAEQAEKAGDSKVAAMFRQIAVDEGDHYRQFKSALSTVQNKP